MKKYLFILKSEIMSNIGYIFNILTNFVGYIVLIFIFLNLWNYIYSNPDEIINGYTRNQMIWYIVITEILYSISGIKQLSTEIVNDIKGGNIAYNLNKPYNYIGYILFKHLGECTIKGIMYAILGVLVGFLFLGELPHLTFLSVVSVLITGIIAIIINSLIVIFISIFSFFIEDSTPFYWIYSKFNLVVGSLFPIEYFPRVFQKALKYSPIYVVSYGPARLFTNFQYLDFVKIFGAQLIYIVISYMLCMLVYMKGVKRLNVNGG